MERIEYSSIEIDSMDKDKLMKTYFELQKAADNVDMNMNFIKQKLKEQFERDNEKSYKNSFGEAVLITQERKQFQQEIAKNFLSENQIKECYKKQQLNFIKMVSAEAKANMKY